VNVKQAGNGLRPSGMEEGCIGSQGPRRAVALEEKEEGEEEEKKKKKEKKKSKKEKKRKKK